MKVTLRRATLDDLGLVVSLNERLFVYEFESFNDAFDTSWPSKNVGYFKDRIEGDDSLVLLAFDGEKVVGYLIGSLKKAELRTFDSFAEGENMLVLEEYRRKGVGKLLLEEFFVWAKTKGVVKARVVASSKNLEAIGVYKKLGFVEYSVTLEKDLL